MSHRVQPRPLLRTVARAEAVTWALLLVGMFLKYVTDTTELGVRVFGMVHGVVFIAYCLTVLAVAVDARWRASQAVLGLVCAVPPFATLWFERYAAARGLERDTWRLRSSAPGSVLERLVAWVVRNPLAGIGAGVVAVAVLTAVALAVGPPVGG
jgi:integral membrane protein